VNEQHHILHCSETLAFDLHALDFLWPFSHDESKYQCQHR